MKKGNGITLMLFGIFTSAICSGQTSFNSCTAAFLNNKMVVDAYTPNGKCVLPVNATGNLTVCTVDLSPTKSKIIDKIPFRVAIRDKQTQTLLMLPMSNVKQVNLQSVLAKCRKGDHIVLLTVSNRYALPHNEILVQ
jgi:hypothetical protein